MSSTAFFTSVINSYLPEPQASLLNGIIFGLPLKADQEFFTQLKIVGLLHIVVLSGINITILASIISSLTSFLSKLISILITILVIIIFIIFVGPKAPIIRAGFMGILTLVAIVYGRKKSSLYLLFLSFIFTIIFWPKWLRTISLYLSYGATLGIILFGKTIQPDSNNFWKKTKDYLWKEIKPSLAAQVFTVPIIFICFKQVSFIAPISNLMISFVIPPLMIFGFLASFLGKINFYLGLIPAYICYGLLTYIIYIIRLLARLPFIYFQF